MVGVGNTIWLEEEKSWSAEIECALEKNKGGLREDNNAPQEEIEPTHVLGNEGKMHRCKGFWCNFGEKEEKDRQQK